MKNQIFTEGNKGNEVMKNGPWKLIPFVSFVCFCLNCPAQSVVDFYLTRITRINTNYQRDAGPHPLSGANYKNYVNCLRYARI